MDRATMRPNWDYVRKLALCRKVVVEIAAVNIRYSFHFVAVKKIGPQALRPKTLFRVGRALRLDVNLLTGSVRIVPNSIAWRKVVAREKVFWTSGRTESVLHGLD